MSHRSKAITSAQRRHFEEAYGPFPVPVTVTDESREFVWVSPAFCTHYVRAANDVLGKTAACLIDDAGLDRRPRKFLSVKASSIRVGVGRWIAC